MRYRVYYFNPVWRLQGDCWDNADKWEVESTCPAEKPEDRQEVKRIPEDQYWLNLVPEEFRSTLSYMAYERGHAYGDAEVMNILSDLCTTMVEPIKAFEKRVLREK